MEKLGFRAKAAYGVGAFGKDMVYSLVATYLMFYYTDIVGLSPLFLGVMFFAARVWDAANDPAMGMIVDNTRTRWGKFRFWILIGTLLNAAALVLLFRAPGEGGIDRRFYAFATYLVWGMSYTVMDIPYWSMIPALTADPRERERIAVIPRVAASLGFFLIASLGLPAAKALAADERLRARFPDQAIGPDGLGLGFFVLAALVSAAFVLTLLTTVLNVPEKETRKAPATGFRETIRLIAGNDQALVVMATMIVFNTVTYLTTGLAIYFFKYRLGSEDLFSRFVVASGAAQVLAMLAFPALAARVRRKDVFALSVFIPIAGYLSMLAASAVLPGSTALFMACGMVLFFGLGLSQVLSTVMLADAVDYGHWKTGKRTEGTLFALQPFVVKFSSALSALAIGAGLSAFGFKANRPQTPLTLAGISALMFVVPIAGLLGSLAIYRGRFTLHEALRDRIRTELDAREESA